MPLLDKLKIDRASGPTVLSRKASARAVGELADPDRFTALWPRLLPAIGQAIAAIDAQDLVLESERDAAAGREALASLPQGIKAAEAVDAAGRLLAATATALLAASRAPRGAWGVVDPKGARFLAYVDDWMHGAGGAALENAARLIEAGAANPDSALESEAKAALEATRAARVDGFYYPMVRLAEERGIPWHVLSNNDMIVVYGQGRRQRWVRGTLLDSQSCASVHITLQKDRTSRLLANAGFPVPEFRTVTSREAAEAAARALGFPLVVKPVASSRAENVHLWLNSAEEVGDAFDACGPEAVPVMVERQGEGDPYRISVLGGRAVAAVRHALPSVIGDGSSTIEQLVAARDERASLPVPDKYARFTRFNRDYYALQMARRLDALDLAPDSVLDAGREVILGEVPQRRNGGFYVDVTDRVHPGLMRMAEDAAEVLGTPMLGLDLITTDIAQPPGTVPLVINEVNSAPGLRAHEQPERQRNAVVQALESVFPAGDRGRIPIAAFYAPVAPEVLAALETLLTAAGLAPGVADSEYARVAGYALRPRTLPAAHPGTAVIRDRRVGSAVFAVGDNDLTRRGVPSDHIDVAAFPETAFAEASRARRPAMCSLAILPGRLLLTPLGGEAEWLRRHCPHRRWIAVGGPGSSEAEAEAALAAGAEVVLCEHIGAGPPRALLLGPGRRDALAGALTVGREEAELWALAALLGLDFEPLAVCRLARAMEARHGVPA